MRRVSIIDTRLFCSSLRVPGKDTCGSGAEVWDFPRVVEKFAAAERDGTLVLPLATLIETGNHISQVGGDRHGFAVRLRQIVQQCLDERQVHWSLAELSEEIGGVRPLKVILNVGLAMRRPIFPLVMQRS